MFVPPQMPLNQLVTHATQLHRSGNLSAASGVYRQILRQQPRNPEILGRLAQTLIGLGQVDEAQRSLEQAMKLAPKEPQFHHDMHLLHRRKGDFVKAHESVEKALRLAPRHPVYTASKAELHLTQTEYDKAMKVIEPVLGLANEHAAVAMVLASLSARFGRESEAIAALRSNAGNIEVGPVVRMRCSFALANLLDWTGDFAGAAAAAETANALNRREWDHAAHAKKVDRCIEVWTREFAGALPEASADASDLVLVVGMPRCGNLLVTRMLAALDATVSVGERNNVLNAAREMEGASSRGAPILLNTVGCTNSALTQRASAYLSEMRTAHPNAKRLIDRNAMNALNLGLASRMLPNVRVVHCTRDAADSAVSCWFAPFTANVPFMYEQTSLGGFQRDTDRLLAHWKAVLDLPIHEVRFEDLIAQPEAVARGLAEFVGAEWNDNALVPARHWVTTVTQPDGTMRDLYPDGRPGIAKDYEAHLPALMAALRA